MNSKHDKLKEIHTYTYHNHKVIRQRQREHFESIKGEATYHTQGILNKINSWFLIKRQKQKPGGQKAVGWYIQSIEKDCQY